MEDSGMSTKLPKRVVLLIVIIGTVLIGSLYYRLYTNPLPKDEELIAYFQAHRSEFEELVRRYRQYVPQQRGMHHLWKEQGNSPQLLKRAGVRWFSTARGYWFPDPYSSRDYEARRKELSEKYQDVFESKYSGLAITLDDPRYGTTSLSKTLLNFPEAPRIKQGVLIEPGGNEEKQVEKRYADNLIFSSLNDNIPKKGYCALRQIESQWFIDVCHY
jgi:hypothetical protein